MTLEPPRSAEAGSDQPDDELAALRRRMAVMEMVLDESTDPIFNILEDGTYRYVNQAFSGPFGRVPGEVIGSRIWDLFSPEEAHKRMTVVRKAFATGELIVFEVRVPTPAGDTFYLTSFKPILDEKGRVTSVVCISKNITARMQAERERVELIEHLQAALQEVKALSGLLPICSHCKKIRNEAGEWATLEAYIQGHSEAQFTHGICPDCRLDYFRETV